MNSEKEKLFLADSHMDSATVRLIKTHHLSRSPANKRSEVLGALLVKECLKRNIKISYDVSYGGHPQDLRYSEFLAGLGGLQVGPCAGDMVRLMYAQEYDESNNLDYAALINDSLYDKYLVHDYDIPQMRGVVFLPGSNLLKKSIDKEKLNAAVLLGAKVKFHPLTNDEDVHFIINEYGEDAVIPRLYSGFKAMFKANLIYATCTTELALYAILLNKYVIDIGNGHLAGGYVDIFNYIKDSPNQKVTLNKALNNPHCGIIFKEEQINPYLDAYQAMYLKYKEGGMRIPALTPYKVI